MKAILSEIKKNLQGTNSEAKKAEIQINNLEHKEEINIQPEQQEEEKISKKTPQRCKVPLGHLQRYPHLNHRGTRRRRGGTRN